MCGSSVTGDVDMLVCYLDDSGKDPQNRVTTIAGYVGLDREWAAFETKVEPLFRRQPVLHATDLEGSRGEFRGWSVLKKQAFVARFCAAVSQHAMLGVSMSCVKDVYDVRAKESLRKRTSRPYTFCMNVIIDWILRDIRTGKAAWTEGVALIVEAGHEHNGEAERNFHQVIKQHRLSRVLRSIRFVSKQDSRAIQAADLLAFYTRRDSNALWKATQPNEKPYKPEQMLKIITERGQFRGFVATDFEPRSPTRLPDFSRIGVRAPLRT